MKALAYSEAIIIVKRGPSMLASNRYQLQRLNFLEKTCNQSYRKRKPSGYGLSQSLRSTRHSEAKEHPKSNIIRSAEKQSAGKALALTTKGIKDKLNEIFTQSYNQNNVFLQNRNQVFAQTSRKKSESFRISSYRQPFRRKNQFRGIEGSTDQGIKDICQQFRVKEAQIERRQSANDPKQYQRLGLQRNFLKFHGEQKCFQKAVQFRSNNLQENTQKKSFFVEKEKWEMAKDFSLSYSSDEVEWGEVEGWHKPIGVLEWSIFSNLEGSVN